MGHQVKELFINIVTYFLTGIGIVVNLENVKSIILFLGAMVLLILQIILYVIKINKERKEK